MTDNEFSQEQDRLQCLDDPERVIEDRDHTIERLKRALENERRHRLKPSDCDRPEDFFRLVKDSKPGWPRAKWEKFGEELHRFLSETRP